MASTVRLLLHPGTRLLRWTILLINGRIGQRNIFLSGRLVTFHAISARSGGDMTLLTRRFVTITRATYLHNAAQDRVLQVRVRGRFPSLRVQDLGLVSVLIVTRGLERSISCVRDFRVLYLWMFARWGVRRLGGGAGWRGFYSW